MLDDGAVGQRCAELVAPFEDVHRVEKAIEAQDLQPALDWISKCETPGQRIVPSMRSTSLYVKS
eukprot:2138471-Pleurochrysis_carterae.AAC.1